MSRSGTSYSLLVASLCGILILVALYLEDPRPAVERGGRRPAARNLLIVLDIGHGGRDPGASVRVAGGQLLTEHAVAYDVGARLAVALRQFHDVHAVSIIRFPPDGGISDAPVPHSPIPTILETTPPGNLQDVPSRTAVNLRWMLSNSIFRAAVESHRTPSATLFLSLHVDVRPSADNSGVALYLPPASPGSSRVAATPEYLRFHEAQVHFAGILSEPPASANGREDSEQLADLMLADLRQAKVTLCPVPEYNRSWQRQSFPAVLNYNVIPARLLVELGNLVSPDDREHLMDPGYRQRIADAIAQAIEEYQHSLRR